MNALYRADKSIRPCSDVLIIRCTTFNSQTLAGVSVIIRTIPEIGDGEVDKTSSDRNMCFVSGFTNITHQLPFGCLFIDYINIFLAY